MGLFLSTYIHKVDKKGRVSVPASFRATLSRESFPGFIVLRSYRYPALECLGQSRMERLSQTLDTLDLFSEAREDFTATLFADAEPIPFDGDGRVILPRSLLEQIGVSEEIAFVGRGPTFQLWLPKAFASHQGAARGRLRDSAPSLKLVDGAAPVGRGES
ncbi:MAG: division/cell wall cluster transcriptional repressor MraZ [Holosporales bacterium]